MFREPGEVMASDGGAAVEAELEELTRRYKLMEGDRKAYAEEVQVCAHALFTAA